MGAVLAAGDRRLGGQEWYQFPFFRCELVAWGALRVLEAGQIRGSDGWESSMVRPGCCTSVMRCFASGWIVAEAPDRLFL
jgi:hypothetical protein